MQAAKSFDLKRWFRWRNAFRIAGGAAVLVAVGIFGYFYLVPRSVAAFVVEAAPAVIEIRGPTLLDAIDKVIVTARIQGYLKTVEVDKNDRVVAGQVLARIDSADIESQLLGAKADADAADQAVAEARSSLDGVKALADKAKAEFERKRSLVPTGAASQADFINAEAAYRQTQADVTRAEVTIERLLAQAASARANQRLLEVRLGYATIRSSLDGIVVSRNRNVGDLLTPGVALMEVVDPNTLILTARFDESVLGIIQPGQQAAAHFTAEPEHSYKGTVLRLIRKVDEETREFEADIKLDELPAIWALDERATVVISANSNAPTIIVPQDLISRRRGRVGVWKSEDGRATWEPITLGYPAGTSIQVLSGLVAGDRVLPPKQRYEFEPIHIRDQQSHSAAAQ